MTIEQKLALRNKLDQNVVEIAEPLLILLFKIKFQNKYFQMNIFQRFQIFRATRES